MYYHRHNLHVTFCSSLSPPRCHAGSSSIDVCPPLLFIPLLRVFTGALLALLVDPMLSPSLQLKTDVVSSSRTTLLTLDVCLFSSNVRHRHISYHMIRLVGALTQRIWRNISALDPAVFAPVPWSLYSLQAP